MGSSRITNREDPSSYFFTFLYGSYKEVVHYVLLPALVVLTQVTNKQVCIAHFTYVHAWVSKNAAEGSTPRQEGPLARHQLKAEKDSDSLPQP
jgi:hypothetical protein